MWRAFFVSLGIIVLPLIAAVPTVPDPVANLQRKYSWGSIFLTYSSLADLANTFQNKALASGLATHGDADALGLLKRFVTQHTSVRYGESAAFLQLDLAAQRAGFMPTNAVDGTVTPLPWSPAEVGRVALLIDKYLSANSSAIAFTRELAKRTDVAGSWQQLTALANNPLVAPRITYSAKIAFRQLMEVRAGELKKLRTTDPTLMQALDDFRHHVDEEIAMRPFDNQAMPGPGQAWANYWEYAQYPTGTTSTTGSDPGWYGSLSTSATDTTGWYSTSMTSTSTTTESTDPMSSTSTTGTNTTTETTSTRL
ncbi:MAG TPA: hypothetical protein VNN25_08945 [Thermoanaerobaculia bacterium]|nr:hypothetical protein [Thermoanaerobaculia bacterium]